MSISNKTYVAQQETLVEVRDKIGNTDDTGGSYNSGTVNGKINTAILGISGVNNGIEGLNNRLDGVVTPYGKGTYGDLIVGPDLAWPSQDGFNRYVLHTKSMTIPEGVTLKPPEKCDGLYILSQGDVTINGVIDVRGMRKTFDADLQLAPTINVGSQEFVLAKGGYSPKGGSGGSAGTANWRAEVNEEYTALEVDSGGTPNNSIAGNINGGGVGAYGKGGNDDTLTIGKRSSSTKPYYMTIRTAHTAVADNTYNESAPAALVIIAKGKVTINGIVIASGTEGILAKGGTKAYDSAMSTNDIYSRYVHNGKGGDGAIAPSGGGPVTIICNELINNGTIDTNGKKFTSAVGENGASELTEYVTNINPKVFELTQTGAGGKGGTFISTAGEIKVYTGVSE